MLETWNLTVLSDKLVSAAISPFDLPCEIWDFPTEKGAQYYIKIELKKHSKGDKIHPIVFPNL